MSRVGTVLKKVYKRRFGSRLTVYTSTTNKFLELRNYNPFKNYPDTAVNQDQYGLDRRLT